MSDDTVVVPAAPQGRLAAWQDALVGPAPLFLVLAIQAWASARLIHANTAFQDEGLYLWAGHLEIANWLHGTPIPAFATYFSGSPVIYPPLGALADSIGGLVAARVLSLALMLGATSLGYATAVRLIGRRGAFFSAALFATLGVTLRLGAFATYDALSLFLVAAATYMAVRSGDGRFSSGWLAGAAALLALSNATKYASAIFDPVVVAVVFLVAVRDRPWRAAFARAATMAVYLASMLGLALAVGGGEYVQGIAQTTLVRASADSPAKLPLAESWHLIGLVFVLALIGALACLWSRLSLPVCLLLALLAAASVLVPLEQARIHTMTSLDKHVDFGAWFAVLPAGYAVDWAITRLRPHAVRVLAVAACVVLLVVPFRIGLRQSRALFRSWPNATHLVASVRAVLADEPGPILAEHPQPLSYYTPQGVAWYRWSSTFTIRLPHGRSVSAGVGTPLTTDKYLSLIRGGYFSTVELDFGPTGAMDQQLERLLDASREYRFVGRVPYGKRGADIWTRRTGTAVPNAALAPDRPSVALLQGVLNPLSRPNGVLGPIVGSVVVTGVLTLLFTFGVRLVWRRRKAVGEL